jgi:DAPG hydrolase PhiG domain
MEFADRARLLDPAPMPLELGWERLPTGVLHVAIRTDMHNCSGEMFEWWFASRIGTREYRWWHPLDHISSAWIEGTPGTIPGSIHQVEERFTGSPPEKLSIQFREPSEYFDAAAIEAAQTSGAVSALLCVRGGAGHQPRRTPDGAVIGTRLIHVGRNVAWGMVLRSHFFMGEDLAATCMPAGEIEKIFPEYSAPGLLQHCYDEFTTLSRVLPSVWLAEGCPQNKIITPW